MSRVTERTAPSVQLSVPGVSCQGVEYVEDAQSTQASVIFMAALPDLTFLSFSTAIGGTRPRRPDARSAYRALSTRMYDFAFAPSAFFR
jgi:hypothetical protein